MDEAVAMQFAADVEEAVASVRELATSAQELADTAKEAQDGVAGIAAPAAEAGDAIKGVADSSTAADEALATTATEARSAAAAYGELGAAAKEAAGAQGEAATATETAGTAAQGAVAKTDAASAAAAGGGVAKYKMALVGIGIGTAVAIDGAAKFQAETTRLVTSAGESAGNLDKVRQGMLGISAATDTSTSEMASGMYVIESAGYHGANGLTVLKAAAQGAKDEGAQLSTVANGVTDALVDYHLPASDAANVTSQLIAAVSHGKTNFEEFSSSMSNVLPLASAMHLKLADVSGVLAEMTAHGMSAQQASQDEANAMRELMKPNAAMVKEFTALGISSKQVYESLGTRGLAGTMQWLSGVAKDGSAAIGQNYTQALGKLMGTAPGLVTALMVSGENAKATGAAIKGIGDASADAQGNVDGFATVSQTASFKMGAAKESIAAAGIALGEVLLPALTAVLGPVTKFLQGIAGNKTEAIAFAVVVGGVLAGALGMKLAGALKDAKEGISALGDGAEWLIGKITGVSAATEAQAGATDALTVAKEESVGATEAAAVAQDELDVAMDANPIGLIILAIAALIAIVALVVTHLHFFANAFDVVRHAVAEAGHDIAGVFDRIRHDIAAAVGAVIDWLSSHWKLILSILLDPLGTLVMEIKAHTHQIAEAFDQVRHDVAAIFDGWVHDMEHNWDTIRHDIAAFADWVPAEISSLWNKAVALNVKALEILQHDVASAFDAVRHDVAAGVDDVLAFFEKLPGQIMNFLVALPGEMLTIGENVIRGLINGIINAAASIPSIMGSLASDVASYFTDPLKLFSPSRLFFDHGFNIVQGAINGVKANAPNLLATMRGLGTGVGAAGIGAASAVAPASGSTTVHVPVQVTAQGMTPDYTSPQFTQYIQGVVQEGVLRYGQLNPGNGLTPAWGH